MAPLDPLVRLLNKLTPHSTLVLEEDRVLRSCRQVIRKLEIWPTAKVLRCPATTMHYCISGWGGVACSVGGWHIPGFF